MLMGWNSLLANAGPILPFPIAPSPFAGGFSGPGYDQPQPSNVTIVMPPQATPSSPPVLIIREEDSRIRMVQAPKEAPAARPPAGAGMRPELQDSSPETESNFHVYRTPAPEPAVQNDYPLLISLKDGWAYTATKSWVKGRTFHFVTTQGDQMQVPLVAVDRIYQRPKPGGNGGSGPAPVR
jgi:hypothetical protein